jgi:hypothetical protein
MSGDIGRPPVKEEHNESPRYRLYERRAARRYGISLDLEYAALFRHTAIVGRGLTKDLSSRAVLFDAEADLPTRARIEISVAWPRLDEAGRPLRLTLLGRLHRRTARGYIAMVERYSLCAAEDVGRALRLWKLKPPLPAPGKRQRRSAGSATVGSEGEPPSTVN